MNRILALIITPLMGLNLPLIAAGSLVTTGFLSFSSQRAEAQFNVVRHSSPRNYRAVVRRTGRRKTTLVDPVPYLINGMTFYYDQGHFWQPVYVRGGRGRHFLQVTID